MNLIQRLDKLSHEVGNLERNMDKCSQVSRTKKEINQIAAESKSKAASIKKEIAAYRNNLVPLVAGANGNTISDEVMAMCEDIGNALYHLCNNEINEASRILAEINMRTRGY